MRASQTITVLSRLPETIRLPSGLNATLVTALVCPRRVIASCPVLGSQIFIVLSELPETIRLPSGLKAPLLTRLLCPLSVRISVPFSASQSLTFLPTLRIRFASGLKVTLCAPFVPSVRISRSCLVNRKSPYFHNFPSLSEAGRASKNTCGGGFSY